MAQTQVLVSHCQMVRKFIIVAMVCIYTYVHTTADGCSFEKDAIYGIAWPSTAINMNATNNCPSGIGMDVL